MQNTTFKPGGLKRSSTGITFSSLCPQWRQTYFFKENLDVIIPQALHWYKRELHGYVQDHCLGLGKSNAILSQTDIQIYNINKWNKEIGITLPLELLNFVTRNATSEIVTAIGNNGLKSCFYASEKFVMKFQTLEMFSTYKYNNDFNGSQIYL